MESIMKKNRGQIGYKPFTNTVKWIALVAMVADERRALCHLTDTELRDIGVTRGQACNEANRSLWDLPHSRRN
jgi:uncharacterized protein YjiS (DUF1127 family)